MITLQLAAPEDADSLTDIQTRTFDEDSRRHGRGEKGGPPGYDSAAWLLDVMGRADCYKFLLDGVLAGAAIIFDEGGGHYYLGRIFIATEYQNRGLGAQAIALIEAAYPAARRWALDTPEWALRNQHFYERHGYVRIGQDARSSENFDLVLYEKVVT